MDEKATLRTHRESESSTVVSLSSDSDNTEVDLKMNSGRRYNGLVAVTTGIVALSLLLSIASIVISIMVFSDKHREKDLGSCVPCQDLIVGPPQFQDNDFNMIVERRLVSDKEYCCASSDDYISSFYNLVSIKILAYICL